VQRRGGWGASVSDDGTTGTLPGQGSTGGVDRVPIVAATAYTKSNRKGSRVQRTDTDTCLDGSQAYCVGHTCDRDKDADGKIPIGYHHKDDVGSLKQPSGNQQDCETRFRRLTPTECERLQGWPDDHTAIGLYHPSAVPKSQRNGHEYVLQLISDTQRYRVTGNGVTADVIREVVKKMMLVGCFS